MQRVNHLALPSHGEMIKLLAIGQRRLVPFYKESRHYPDFSSIKRLLAHCRIETEFFDLELSKDQFSLLYKTKLEKETKRITAKFLKLTKNSKFPLSIRLLDQIYDYLSKEDLIEKADLIFVFGAKSTFRIKKAVELFHKKFAPLLVVSGGSPLYIQNKKTPESLRDKRFAIRNGVPANKIIKEDTSVTMPDNVRSSLNLLDQLGINFKSIILINSPYSQRRGWVYFKKNAKRSIKLIRVNSQGRRLSSRNFWYRNEKGIQMVLNEFFKMKISTFLNSA